MPVRIKNKKEIEILREGGRRLARILGEVAKKVSPGVTPRELNTLAEKLIREIGDEPAFLNYQPDGAGIPFPATLCVSVNDEVVHGIPTERELMEGDIVGLDLGIKHKGMFTDMAVTVGVGRISPKAEKLIEVTREALARGIAAVKPGGHVGDIGFAIETHIKPHGYGIVEILGGHGVGHEIHESPFVPNFGKRGEGEELRPGMVIAIEPMINEGSALVKLGADEFTFKTRDGSLSAHFEHTILITDSGHEILTKIDL